MSNLGRQFNNVPIPEGTRIRQSGGVGHIKGDKSRSVTKMLPIETVKKYREFDREGSHSYGKSGEETIQSITKELRGGGVIKEPLMIEHSQPHNWGYLGEGHHRLIAAERAGLTHVPVFIYSNERGLGFPEQMKKGVGAPLTSTTDFAKQEGFVARYHPNETHPDHFKELR
jgi:hypothetical protein